MKEERFSYWYFCLRVCLGSKVTAALKARKEFPWHLSTNHNNKNFCQQTKKIVYRLLLKPCAREILVASALWCSHCQFIISLKKRFSHWFPALALLNRWVICLSSAYWRARCFSSALLNLKKRFSISFRYITNSASYSLVKTGLYRPKNIFEESFL